jgi:hypothetical protein
MKVPFSLVEARVNDRKMGKTIVFIPNPLIINKLAKRPENANPLIFNRL